MRVSIAANALVGLLGKLNGIPTRGPLAVLDHVAITIGTTEDSVTIQATDLDTWGQVSLGDIVGDPGTVVVPFAMLLAFARTQGEKNLKIEAEGAKVVVTSGKAKVALPALHKDDFPHIADDEPTGTVNPAAMVWAIRQTKYAACEDEARPNLRGIYFAKSQVSATDGHRAVVIPAITGLADVLISEKFAGIIERQMPKLIEADVAVVDGRVTISTPDMSFGCRQVVGTFPDVSAFLPKFECTTVLPRVAMVEACKAAAIIQPKNDLMRIRVAGRAISLAAVGESSMFEHELDGGDWQKSATVNLNCRYLLEALTVMSGDNIEVSMTDALSPVLLHDGEATHVIMPMRG